MYTYTYRTEIVDWAFSATGGPSFVCIPPSFAWLTLIRTLLRFKVPCSTQQMLTGKQNVRKMVTTMDKSSEDC
jgi:hypothetical protein